MSERVAVPQREALYAAICEHPEDDTLRLAFADYLDGLDAPEVKCSNCSGKGEVITATTTITEPVRYYRIDCGVCRRIGTVRDTGDADLAEFIRCQVRMANPPWNSKDMIRAGQLEQNYGDRWRRAGCEECGGKGGRVAKVDGGYGTEHIMCRTCDKTGDLFRRWHPSSGRGIHEPRPVTFARGLIDSVGCTLAELGEERDVDCPSCFRVGKVASSEGDRQVCCPTCGGRGTVRRFVPTKWAEAVVRNTPVMRFVIPLHEWGFVRPVEDTAESRFVLDDECPAWLYQFISGEQWPGTHYKFKMLGKGMEPVHVLSIAAGRAVRRAAYRTEVTS